MLEFEKSMHVDSNFFKSSFGLQIIVLILNSMTTNDIDRLILNHAVWDKAWVMASVSDVSLYSRSPFWFSLCPSPQKRQKLTPETQGTWFQAFLYSTATTNNNNYYLLPY